MGRWAFSVSRPASVPKRGTMKLHDHAGYIRMPPAEATALYGCTSTPTAAPASTSSADAPGANTRETPWSAHFRT